MEKKLEVCIGFDEWLPVQSIQRDTVETTEEWEDGLSADYLDIVRLQFPSMKFRGV